MESTSTNPREAAKDLLDKAIAKTCRFPKIWDEKQQMQECGKTILLFRHENGAFDTRSALDFLIDKYGVENNKTDDIICVDDDIDEEENRPTNKSSGEVICLDNDGDDDEGVTNKPIVDKSVVTAPKRNLNEEGKSSTKKRKSSVKNTGGEESPEKAKKVKKSETYVVEANRSIGDAIKEMAELYFKAKDMRKGGVFSKAAKAIRDTDVTITTKKQATSLFGVGKVIAGYIEELQTTGMIQRLEEMRAGIA